jgi:hypothetical protein
MEQRRSPSPARELVPNIIVTIETIDRHWCRCAGGHPTFRKKFEIDAVHTAKLDDV